MNAREAGFLLLTSKLGNPDRKTLSAPQLRTLGQRIRSMESPREDRDLEVTDLLALGYGQEMAGRILALMEEEKLLEHYLRRAGRVGCAPLCRVNGTYPRALKQKLDMEAPGCLWTKGDLSILNTRMIAVVGSRDLMTNNREFAEEAGRQAALQGYTLVSGNARGADRTAQNACLKAGGRVVSIVADELWKQEPEDRILYVSEDGFDEEFSAQRALSRNRCIHALGEKTLVAQCSYQKGGTWDGTVKNLRFGWSPVFGLEDGTPGMDLLEQMGLKKITMEDLKDLSRLTGDSIRLF